jgi:Secretion system C-terminal sorting domain
VTTTCFIAADQRITLYEITETCNDVAACNYDPEGTTDATCVYPEPLLDCEGNCLADTDGDLICDDLEIPGCLDENACNYNPNATDSADCEYAQVYVDCAGNCLTDTDGDSICDQLEVAGCMDTEACNFNPNATDEDETCAYLSNYSISGPTTYNILEGIAQQFSYPSTAGSTYLWTTTMGTIISGQGTSEVSISYNLPGSDEVGVVETNEAGCISDTAYHTIDLLETGIDELVSTAHWFYPNPTTGTIVVENSIPAGTLVQIMDLSGRTVALFTVNGTHQLVLDQLPSGYYLLHAASQIAPLLLIGR